MKYLLAACATVLTVLVFGYDYGVDPNLAQVLPYVNRLLEPSLYTGDAFVSSFSAFPSVYPRLAALGASLMSLEKLHLAAYLAARFAFFLVVFELGLELFRSRRSAAAAVLLAALSAQVNVLTPLGEDPLIKTALYQSTLAGLACAASLFYFLKSRYRPAFALLGAALFLNGLAAAYLAILFAAASPGAWDRRLRNGWLLFVAVFACWAAWAASLPNPGGGAGPAYLAVLRRWYPGHYFPFSWTAAKWFGAAVLVPLNALLIIPGLKGCSAPGRIKAFLLAFAAMWGAAFVFGELLPERHLVALQLLRSDSLFCLLGVVFAGDLLRRLLEGEAAGDWALAAYAALSQTGLNATLFVLPLPFLLAARFYGNGKAFRAAALGGALCCAFLAFHADPAAVKKTALALLLLALAAAAGLSYRSAVSRRLAFGLALLIVLMPLLPVANYRLRNGQWGNYPPETSDWVGLQLWARANTQRNALFLVPPGTYGFRVFSLRSPVVEWLDCSAMHWAPGFEKDWARRMTDMNGPGGGDGRDLGYGRLDERALASLAAKYGAGYAVRRAADAQLRLPEVYANASFTVYAL